MKQFLAVLIALSSACSSPTAPNLAPDNGQPDSTVPDASAGDASGERRDAGDDGNTSGPDGGAVDSGSDLPVIAGLTFADYCRGLAVEYSRWLATCYGSIYDPTDELLIGRFDRTCMRAEPSVAAGRIAYDGAQAQRCIDALADSTCDGFAFFESTPECVDVTMSAQPIGGECFGTATNHFAIAGECVDSFCPRDTCPATCRAFQQVDEPCGDSLLCDPASTWCDFTAGVCRIYLAVGQDCSIGPCGQGMQCRNDLCEVPIQLDGACDVSDDGCVFGTFCSAGTCSSPAASGQPCASSNHCADFSERCIDGVCGPPGTAGVMCESDWDCANGFVCEADSCTALPGIAAPCDNERCGAGLWCRHETLGDSGVCTSLGAQGEPCAHGYEDAYVHTGCATGLFCIGGTCLPRGGAGDPCDPWTRETCGLDLFCNRTTMTCSPTADDGQPCNPAWELPCAEGLSCHCGQDDATCGTFERDVNPGDTCAPQLPIGATCWRSVECQSLNCFDHDEDLIPTCRPGVCNP